MGGRTYGTPSRGPFSVYLAPPRSWGVHLPRAPMPAPLPRSHPYVKDSLGPFWRPSWAISELPSWGPSCAVLGGCHGHPGPARRSLARLGLLLGLLGHVCRPSSAIMRLYWGPLGPFLAAIGAILGALGAVMGASWASLGALSGHLGAKRAPQEDSSEIAQQGLQKGPRDHPSHRDGTAEGPEERGGPSTR